ncbi:MAG: choice-of-anchor Q domain-containing protein [Deltaproteobacteria bacterium]
MLQQGEAQDCHVDDFQPPRSALAAGGAFERVHHLQADGTATFTLQGSILTHPNLGAVPNRPQCAGPLALSLQGRNNLIDGFTCQGPALTFRSGALTPLLLDPLANYGGPTRTLRPPAGSNAIDLIVGNCTNPVLGVNLIEDQRTFPRPVNNCDGGAYEQ